ncbi:FAD/NAD(P)-binding domain-containing protein, partial [Lindgomyces ingoldianus]
LSGKHIILAGAGISSLSFAISLHKLWPSLSNSNPRSTPPRLTLYDRDSSAAPAGREGYSLSIRSDAPSAGVQTLLKMGMLEPMLERAVTSIGDEEEGSEKGGFVVWDHGWREVLKVRSKVPVGCPVSGMRVSRKALRQTLVEAAEELEGVEIIWGTAITGLSPAPSADRGISTGNGNGDILVHLSNSHTATCDLLIDASGSSSKPRTLLRPTDTLQFAGPVVIAGTCPLSTSPSTSSHDYGMILPGTGHCLFIAPINSTGLGWALSWKQGDPVTPKKQPLEVDEVVALLEEARQKGVPAFGPRFAQMLDQTQKGSVMMFNAMDKPGFAHTSDPTYITSPSPALQSLAGKVVFLGDANHAVSPFAGNGANLAIMDGWAFAEALVQSTDAEEALKRYDGVAVRKAEKVVRMSHFVIRVAHSGGWALWGWMWVLRLLRLLFF